MQRMLRSSAWNSTMPGPHFILNQINILILSKFLERISQFHQGDSSPLADQPKLEEGITAELSPDLQEGLTHYSMVNYSINS